MQQGKVQRGNPEHASSVTPGPQYQAALYLMSPVTFVIGQGAGKPSAHQASPVFLGEKDAE